MLNFMLLSNIAMLLHMRESQLIKRCTDNNIELTDFTHFKSVGELFKFLNTLDKTKHEDEPMERTIRYIRRNVWDNLDLNSLNKIWYYTDNFRKDVFEVMRGKTILDTLEVEFEDAEGDRHHTDISFIWMVEIMEKNEAIAIDATNDNTTRVKSRILEYIGRKHLHSRKHPLKLI
jgi:hypothetical protein